MSNFLNKSFVINLLIILSIFGLDRFSKAYVISINEKSLSSDLFVSKYLNINLIYNEGIAFGLSVDVINRALVILRSFSSS